MRRAVAGDGMPHALVKCTLMNSRAGRRAARGRPRTYAQPSYGLAWEIGRKGRVPSLPAQAGMEWRKRAWMPPPAKPDWAARAASTAFGFLISPSSRQDRPAPRRSPGSAPKWSRWRIPSSGDPGRSIGGKPGVDDPYFLLFNANKKSITVNLKDPKGLHWSRTSRRQADVFCENFAPGAIERLGLGCRRDPRDESGDHLLPGEGLRRRQPVRKKSRIRHDRAGLRRHHEHHRRARRPAVEARPVARRYRHRHAAGDFHSRRAVPAQGHRPGRASAGGDAGRDAALHPHRLRRAEPQRQRQAAGRAADSSVSGVPTPPMGTFPCKGGGLERLRLRLHQPRQSGTLAAAAGRDRPRGPDRRHALRHAGGARRTAGRGQRDDRRLDDAAHQTRGDGNHRRGRRSGGRGARHAWNCTTTRRSSNAASCRRSSIRPTARSRWPRGRCGSPAARRR